MAPVMWMAPWSMVSGALASAAGSASWMFIQPPTDCSRLFRYPDQPTATVDAANRYSSTSIQPMNQATISPRVA